MSPTEITGRFELFEPDIAVRFRLFVAELVVAERPFPPATAEW